MSRAENHAAFLPVQIEARSQDLCDHLHDCRDLAQLLFFAASSIPREFAEPIQIGLTRLLADLEAATDALEAEGEPPSTDAEASE